MTRSNDRRAPSPTEMVLVDGLLTLLCRRMAGALDLGLIFLMEPPPEHYARFVSEHVAAPMRAAALVLRLTVAECVAEPALTPFQAVEVDTEGFLQALADLSGFVTMSEAQLVTVAGRLEAAYRRLTDTFLDIAERLCFEPSLEREFGEERRESTRFAIEGLPASLAAQRREMAG